MISMTWDGRDNSTALARGDVAVGVVNSTVLARGDVAVGVVGFGVAVDGMERRAGGRWSKGGVMCPGCLGKGGAMVERMATWVSVVAWGDMAADGDEA